MLATSLVKHCIVIFLLLCALFARPALLSDSMYWLSGVWAVAVIFLILLHGAFGGKYVINQSLFVFTFILFLFWLSLLVQAYTVTGGVSSALIKATAANFIIPSTFFAAFLIRGFGKRLFDILSLFFSVIGYLAGVSFLLFIFGYALFWFDLTAIFPGVRGEGVTITGAYFHNYFTISQLDVMLPRFNHYFVEPGAAAPFYAWSMIWSLSRGHKCKVWGSLIGLLATVSTLIIIFAPIFIIFLKIKDYKSSLKIVLILFFGFVFSVCFVLFFPYIGIFDKLDTHGAAVLERFQHIYDSFYYLLVNPLGAGLYVGEPVYGTINLLYAASEIGVIPLLLYLLIPFYLSLISQETLLSIFIMAPLLLASLFSQPLIDAPLYYIVLSSALFCNFKNIDGEGSA